MKKSEIPSPKDVRRRASDYAIDNSQLMDDAHWIRGQEQAFEAGAMWMRRRAIRRRPRKT